MKTSVKGFLRCGAVALLFGALALSAARAEEKRGPSTPEERQHALELVEMLETTPDAPEAKEARSWLVIWLSSVPDLTVHFCLDPLGSARDLEPVPDDLKVQAAFSQAAYLIRHPQADPKSPEVFVAGVEGVLSAYQALRAHGGVPRLPAYEALAQEKAAGRLRQVVESRLAHCF
jgi:hypothetical protein